jgi:diguanylate cyclase (GGDEF)-like protein
LKVLVVDDDPTSRLIIATTVKTVGHASRIVADGEAALHEFKSWHPDTVISDRIMPGMNGTELCAAIREMSVGYTYFIMLTSQGTLQEVHEGMAAGADDYLVKPIDTDDLSARLMAATRVSQLHHDLGRQRIALDASNRELASIARRDPLTGLRNRRALDEDLELLEGRVRRYGHRYCVALIDVDHFKVLNDSLGHQAGDRILQSIAAVLSNETRGGDALYRFGGDEFLCVFPEQSLATGTTAVERMRSGLDLLDTSSFGEIDGKITMSVGMAMIDVDGAATALEVLKEADEALYQAKSLGRNRVVIKD